MEKKKRNVILIILGILLIGILILLYFVLRSQNAIYPQKPISQDSLNTTNQPISLNSTKIETSEAYLYTVSNTVMLDKVTTFVQSINPKFKQTANEEGVFYEWDYGEDSVIYELDQDTVIFSIKQGIPWNEVSITNYSFSEFVNKYFGKTWSYSNPDSKKQSEGETIYYAKRVIDGFNVETVLDRQETDYLATKDGKIVYGKILLADLVKSTDKVPLISSADLSKYININGYPKEIYPLYGNIQSTTLSDIDYKSDEFLAITKTLSDCKTTSSSIIYLYKSMDQGNLTPVYKLELQCEIEYKDSKYTIPAIGYVNAIEPKYVSTK